MYVSELPECEISPDPADNPILAAAIAGKANPIVSGDKPDMLALGRVDDIRIVFPASALAEQTAKVDSAASRRTTAVHCRPTKFPRMYTVAPAPSEGCSRGAMGDKRERQLASDF